MTRESLGVLVLLILTGALLGILVGVWATSPSGDQALIDHANGNITCAAGTELHAEEVKGGLWWTCR